MARKTPVHRIAGYAAVVALLVSASLAAAGLFYQLAEHGGHSHPGLSAGEVVFGLSVDAVGLVLALLLATDMMVGQRLFAIPSERFRGVHSALGWSVIAVVALHGGGAVAHTFQGGVEALPVWLDAIGSAAVLALGLQLVTGYRQAGGSAGGSTRILRRAHAWLAFALAVALASHGVLGLVHALSG